MQLAHNKEHNITPRTIIKDTGNKILESLRGSQDEGSEILPASKSKYGGKKGKATTGKGKKSIHNVVRQLEKEMKDAAKNLDFEKAAELRDHLRLLQQELQEKRARSEKKFSKKK